MDLEGRLWLVLVMLVMLRLLLRLERIVVDGSEYLFLTMEEEGEETNWNRAHYSNGELVPSKVGAGAEPRPAAANDGTIISVSLHLPLGARDHRVSYILYG